MLNRSAKLTRSLSRDGEYYIINEDGSITFYKPCGPLSIGVYIRGSLKDQIIRVDGLNYIKTWVASPLLHRLRGIGR